MSEFGDDSKRIGILDRDSMMAFNDLVSDESKAFSDNLKNLRSSFEYLKKCMVAFKVSYFHSYYIYR